MLRIWCWGLRFAPSGLRAEPHRRAGQGPGDALDRLDLVDELPGRIDAQLRRGRPRRKARSRYRRSAPHGSRSRLPYPGGHFSPRPGSARTLGPWPSPSAMSTPPSSSSARQDGRDRVVAFARPSPCAAFALAVEATAGAVVAVNEFRVRAAGAENATRINRVPKHRMRVGRQSHASPPPRNWFLLSTYGYRGISTSAKSPHSARLRPLPLGVRKPVRTCDQRQRLLSWARTQA